MLFDIVSDYSGFRQTVYNNLYPETIMRESQGVERVLKRINDRIESTNDQHMRDMLTMAAWGCAAELRACSAILRLYGLIDSTGVWLDVDKNRHHPFLNTKMTYMINRENNKSDQDLMKDIYYGMFAYAFAMPYNHVSASMNESIDNMFAFNMGGRYHTWFAYNVLGCLRSTQGADNRFQYMAKASKLKLDIIKQMLQIKLGDRIVEYNMRYTVMPYAFDNADYFLHKDIMYDTLVGPSLVATLDSGDSIVVQAQVLDRSELKADGGRDYYERSVNVRTYSIIMLREDAPYPFYRVGDKDWRYNDSAGIQRDKANQIVMDIDYVLNELRVIG